MFVKKITRRDKATKKQYFTYRLVQSYRLAGKPRHRNIIDMGTLCDITKDEHKNLANRIEELLRDGQGMLPASSSAIEEKAQLFFKAILRKYDSKNSAISYIFNQTASTSVDSPEEKDIQSVDLNTFETVESRTVGAEWLCKQAIQEIDFRELLCHELGFSDKNFTLSILSILGRLIYPASERKSADWLNENSAAAYLLQTQDKTVSRKQLSMASNLLYEHKPQIEKYLVNRFRNLFDLRPGLLIYDLSNSHFHGRMMGSRKSHRGRNKQKRNDCPQITIAMAIDEHGFSQHSRFYEGNIGETTTLEQILDELTENIPGYTESFAAKRPVLVMDAGIASEENLKKAHARGFDYIAVSRSQHNNLRDQIDPEKFHEFENANNETVSVQSLPNQIKYNNDDQQTVIIDETVVYVKTQQKKLKEDSIIRNKREKLEQELKHLQQNIREIKKKKTPEDVYTSIGRLKERYKKVNSLYQIQVHPNDDNTQILDLTYKYIEKNKKEQDSGTYFIRTSIKEKDSECLWKTYNKVTEIEALFRILKSDLQMRPAYHQFDIHIESHFFVCILALQVVLFIRHRLKQNNIHLSWSEIIRIMNTQVYNTNTVKGQDKENIIIRSCTRPSVKAKEIYQAMGYQPVPFYRKVAVVNNQ